MTLAVAKSGETPGCPEKQVDIHCYHFLTFFLPIYIYKHASSTNGILLYILGYVAELVKNLPAMQEIPGPGRYLGEGNGIPLQYSCLGN